MTDQNDASPVDGALSDGGASDAAPLTDGGAALSDGAAPAGASDAVAPAEEVAQAVAESPAFQLDEATDGPPAPTEFELGSTPAPAAWDAPAADSPPAPDLSALPDSPAPTVAGDPLSTPVGDPVAEVTALGSGTPSLDLPPIPNVAGTSTPGVNWPLASAPPYVPDPAYTPPPAPVPPVATPPYGTPTPTTPPYGTPAPSTYGTPAPGAPTYDVYSPEAAPYGPTPFAPAGPQPPYGAPLAGPVPYGAPTASDSTTMAAIAHASGILVGFIGPLILYAVKGSTDPYVRAHAVEALNFQLTVLIALVVSSILMIVVIGFVLLPIVGILNIIFPIMATVAATRGEMYRYPVAIRMVK